VRSDHYAMAKMGVPAVMLATGMANGGEAAWAKFLTTNYHQPSDDLSQPINWGAGARFAELNYRVVRELAEAGAPPRWYSGDYFGDFVRAQSAESTKARGPLSRCTTGLPRQAASLYRHCDGGAGERGRDDSKNAFASVSSGRSLSA
jgi:hypothetical protein